MNGSKNLADSVSLNIVDIMHAEYAKTLLTAINLTTEHTANF